MGKTYTRGNPQSHGHESMIRKWVVNQDPEKQVANLNAYTITVEKKYQSKSLEKLLQKLDEYDYTQDLNDKPKVKYSKPQRTPEEQRKINLEELKIREAYQNQMNEAHKKMTGK